MSVPSIEELTSHYESGSPYVCQKESYMGKFSDKRLDKRAAKVSQMLFLAGTSSIHGGTLDESAQKGAYRFLANPQVEESKLVEVATDRSKYLCAGKDILVIQDTTEFNLDNNRNRLQKDSGIGLTGNNKDLGFFCHCSLVLDAYTKAMLGYSDIQLWHRQQNQAEKTKDAYKELPIEQKESYKWIQASLTSKANLKDASTITIIEDREGDIFEQFAVVPDDRTHLLVRSRDNRRLADGSKLHERLAEQACSGQYDIDIVEDIRQGIESRVAIVEVRFCEVAIRRPDRADKSLDDSITLYAIEVKEIGEETDRILWRILTTHKTENYQQALKAVEMYRQRWHVEQLFRLLKKKGFQVESSQLETGWAVRKLTIMLFTTALRVMQLMLAYKRKDSQPITDAFSEKELVCMRAINEKLDGKTEKNKNTFDPTTMSWATWVIARLGGWKNYNSKRPPGPIVLKKGVDKFNMMFEGWELARSQ